MLSMWKYRKVSSATKIITKRNSIPSQKKISFFLSFFLSTNSHSRSCSRSFLNFWIQFLLACGDIHEIHLEIFYAVVWPTKWVWNKRRTKKRKKNERKKNETKEERRKFSKLKITYKRPQNSYIFYMVIIIMDYCVEREYAPAVYVYLICTYIYYYYY